MSNASGKRQKIGKLKSAYSATSWTTCEDTTIKMTHSTSFKNETNGTLRAKVTYSNLDKGGNREIRIEALEPVIVHVRVNGAINIERVVLEKERSNKRKKRRVVNESVEREEMQYEMNNYDDEDDDGDDEIIGRHPCDTYIGKDGKKKMAWMDHDIENGRNRQDETVLHVQDSDTADEDKTVEMKQMSSSSEEVYIRKDNNKDDGSLDSSNVCSSNVCSSNVCSSIHKNDYNKEQQSAYDLRSNSRRNNRG